MTLRQKLACVGLARVRFADRVGCGRRRAAQGPAAALVRPGTAAAGFGAHGARCSAGGCLPHTGGSSSAQRRLTRTGGDPRPHCGRRRGNRPDRDSRRLPIVATSIAGGLTVKNETDIPVSVAALLQQGPATVLPAGEPADPHHAHARERGLHPGRTRPLCRK